MIYVYGGFQVAMLIAWYTIWPSISVWVVFIPTLVATAHFVILCCVMAVALVVILWAQTTQRSIHERRK